MGVQKFLQHSDFISFRYIPRSGLARSYHRTIFNFLRSLHTLLIAAVPGDILTNSAQGCCLSFLSPMLVICLSVNSHSNRCEVIPHCGFDLHFLRLLMSSTFSCYCWPLVCLLWKNVYSDILTILTGFFLL